MLCGVVSLAQTDEEVNVQEKADVPFGVIEQVPVYPGCEQGDNTEQKKCMSDKIQQHVVKHFDKRRIEAADLPAGKYRISVQFKIDETGNVVDIRARANHERIEAEAIRVINLLPKMKPGLQRGANVGVLYALPIVFEIETLKVTKNRKGRKG